jgi:betaine reductase
VKEEVVTLSVFDGKKIVIIGDRDGIPGPAIAECLKNTDAEVVYSATECFV